jgi:twitching motility protein PilU
MVYAAPEVLSPRDTQAQAYSIMTDKQRAEFEQQKEINFSLTVGEEGRFRVNVFLQRETVALVARRIKVRIPSLESLGFSSQLGELMMAERGLILMTGPTGSGKSTTLAAMIDYRNERKGGHIITIEDPVEFIHPHKKALINQREVGIDTLSFHIALKNTLRQAPKVIYIGEIRDTETMEFALHASETGHLVLATLHSNSANQTLERILNFFPHEYHPQILLQLSLNLRAILSQRLIPKIGGGRAPALEVLLNTPYISELICKGEIALSNKPWPRARKARKPSIRRSTNSADGSDQRAGRPPVRRQPHQSAPAHEGPDLSLECFFYRQRLGFSAFCRR